VTAPSAADAAKAADSSDTVDAAAEAAGNAVTVIMIANRTAKLRLILFSLLFVVSTRRTAFALSRHHSTGYHKDATRFSGPEAGEPLLFSITKPIPL
jgi:hypothetical protein